MKYTIEQATKDVAQLYIDRFSNDYRVENEIRMLNEIISNNWPLDKMNRWLGYAQASLVQKGYVTIDQERIITRPYFHRAYKEQGLEIPKSVKV